MFFDREWLICNAMFGLAAWILGRPPDAWYVLGTALFWPALLCGTRCVFRKNPRAIETGEGAWSRWRELRVWKYAFSMLWGHGRVAVYEDPPWTPPADWDVKTVPLATVAVEDTPMIFASFPHGFCPLASGCEFSFGTDALGKTVAFVSKNGSNRPIDADTEELLRDFLDTRRTRVTTTDWFFWLPAIAEIAEWSGCVSVSASAVLENLIGHRRHVVVHPEGAMGVLAHATTGEGGKKLSLFLGDEERGRHDGFLKLAFDNAIPVVPVYAFGQQEQFWASCPSTLVGFAKRVYDATWLLPMLFWGPKLRKNPVLVYGAAVIPCENYDEFVAAFYQSLFHMMYREESVSTGESWKFVDYGAEAFGLPPRSLVAAGDLLSKFKLARTKNRHRVRRS